MTGLRPVTLDGRMPAKTAPPAVGERLRTARQAKQLKQSELADAIKMRPGTIYRIETAGFWPGRTTVRRICRVLGITEAWLLYGADEADGDATPKTPAAVGQYLADDDWGRDVSPQVATLLKNLDYSSIGLANPTMKDVHRARELIEINLTIGQQRHR